MRKGNQGIGYKGLQMPAILERCPDVSKVSAFAASSQGQVDYGSLRCTLCAPRWLCGVSGGHCILSDGCVGSQVGYGASQMTMLGLRWAMHSLLCLCGVLGGLCSLLNGYAFLLVSAWGHKQAIHSLLFLSGVSGGLCIFSCACVGSQVDFEFSQVAV